MPSDSDCGRPASPQALETGRIVLEPLEPRHASELFGPLQEERLYRFIPQEPPATESALRDRYERLAVGRSPDGNEVWLNWAARERKTGSIIGTFQATVHANHSADIAYIVFGPSQRHGFAAEGARRMLDHLRDDLKVTVAGADIDTRNTASIALIERLGFVRVRTTLNADYFKGATSDEYRYERVLET